MDTLFIDVAAGNVKSDGARTIAHREGRKITATQAFDIERLRAEAHNALDIALDDLQEKIDWTNRVRGAA